MSPTQITALEALVDRLEAEQEVAARAGDVETVVRLSQTLSMAYSTLGAAQFSLAG